MPVQDPVEGLTTIYDFTVRPNAPEDAEATESRRSEESRETTETGSRPGDRRPVPAYQGVLLDVYV